MPRRKKRRARGARADRSARARVERISRTRIRILAGAFGLVFAVVVLRAFQVQVLRGPELRERAERQHRRRIDLSPQRGRILDRDGVPLAVSMDVDSIHIDPVAYRTSGADPATTDRLARALGLDRSELEGRLNRSTRFVWLTRRALPGTLERVRELDVPGIGFVPESRRFYPGRSLAAHVVGFVGVDGRGLEGIELVADGPLSGIGRSVLAHRDARGRPLHLSGLGRAAGSRAGSDVVLTLDSAIQQAAEEELEAAVDRYRARGGAVVVLDPRTGDVLALASAPRYNPNAFGDAAPGDRRNRAVADVFEPGSTLKAFLAAAALDAGVVTERSRHDGHGGRIRIGGHVIHDVKPRGELSFTDAIRVSSNVVAAQVALELGADRLGSALGAFGFGRATDLGLPGERTGVLRSPDRWRSLDLASIGFGQGISVTAVQLASAFGAIANEGVRMAPRLVAEIRSPAGSTLERRPVEVAARPVSPEAAAATRRLLEVAAGSRGTGARAALPGYRIGGKTGTAQKVVPGRRGYDPELRVSTFGGYVATDDGPALAAVVMVDEPRGETYGGVVAAPVFREVARRSLAALGIPPVGPGSAPTIPAEADGRRIAEAPGLRTAIDLATPEGIDRGRDRVPDLGGLTIRAAWGEASDRGLDLRPEGRGVCVEQDPPAGAPLPRDRFVRARFAPAHRPAATEARAG